MLKNIIEIIEAFIQKEVEIVSNQEMPHMPTLGDAYECISKDSIERALPSSLDLRVVSGFIRGLPEQIDCMLVHGEGEQYGRTDNYFYDIENVLVVLEVKKTLNKTDLVSAYQQLAPVSKIAFEKFVAELENNIFPDCSDAHRNFSQITGKIATDEWQKLDYSPVTDAMMMSILTLELQFPVKIIHGYGGYKTESGLRNAFLDFLEASDPKKEILGINALPNLITSEKFSLYKTTGLPFVPELTDGYWPIMASSRGNVVELMIEVIWSKISKFCNVKMPWGEDLDIDTSAVLLLAEAIFDAESESGGWKFHTREPNEASLEKARSSSEWKPAFFSEELSTLLMHLQWNSHLDKQSDFFKSVAVEADISEEELRDTLLKTKIMAEENDRYIRFILPVVHMVFLDDGGMIASDDNDRLDAWLSKNDMSGKGKMVFINSTQLAKS